MSALRPGGTHDPGFEAKFPGECAECWGRIEVGDLIEHAIGDGYRHVKCPEARPTRFQGTTLDEMGF